MARIQVRWQPNSFTPLPEKMETFQWDDEEFSYSEDALLLIERLMMGQTSFTVRTSATVDIEQRRSATVFGTANTTNQAEAGRR